MGIKGLCGFSVGHFRVFGFSGVGRLQECSHLAGTSGQAADKPIVKSRSDVVLNGESWLWKVGCKGSGAGSVNPEHLLPSSQTKTYICVCVHMTIYIYYMDTWYMYVCVCLYTCFYFVAHSFTFMLFFVKCFFTCMFVTIFAYSDLYVCCYICI